jgi:3D (Asp-Asp-Asp) domain-containing protein
MCLGRKFDKLNEELATVQNELSVTQDELATTQENYRVEIEKTIGLSEELNTVANELNSVSVELEEANNTISDLKSDEYKLVYMGNFKITYYCDERYSHVCGGNGVTASGKKTEVGVTAAADWSVLPKGSKVYIEGIGWKEIQDVGGGVDGKHIDVLVKTHKDALNLGKDNEGVWLLVKN